MTFSNAVALMAAATPCPQGRAPVVIVVHEAEQPTVGSTYRLEQLRTMARQAGHVGKHPVLGFYASTFGYTLEQSIDDGCPSGAVIRLVLGARHVEVPSDAKAWGCRSEALTEHYLLHAEADAAALTQFAQRVREAVGSLSVVPGQVLPESVLASTVNDLLPRYDIDRAKALSAPETDLAASRLRGACSGGAPGSL